MLASLDTMGSNDGNHDVTEHNMMRVARGVLRQNAAVPTMVSRLLAIMWRPKAVCLSDIVLATRLDPAILKIFRAIRSDVYGIPISEDHARHSTVSVVGNASRRSAIVWYYTSLPLGAGLLSSWTSVRRERELEPTTLLAPKLSSSLSIL